jgi:hypothetical protein
MKRALAAVVIAVLLIPFPAFAITAADVLERLTDKERGTYLTGAIEMAMYLAASEGNQKKAACISDWYFKTGQGPKDVIATLSLYKDKPAAALINALIKRECGAVTSGN